MNIVADLAMNAGVLLAMNASGASDKVNETFGDSDFGVALSSAVISNAAKYGSNLLYQYGVYKIPPSIETPQNLNALVENVAYDTLSMYGMQQLDVYGRVSSVVPGDDMFSVALKQGAVMTASDLLVHTARQAGLLSGASTLISGLESKIESLY